MKTINKEKRITWIALTILILAWPIYKIGITATSELRFLLGTPTQAEITVYAYAKENGLNYSDYPDSMIQLLERNPETKTFVLEYPLKKNQQPEINLSEYTQADSVPLFLQWDQRWGYQCYGDDIAGITGCGPLCLSMTAYYLTGSEEYTPDKMLAYAAGNGYYASGYGSSWTLISEGAKNLGFTVTELPLVKSRIFDNLEAGNPIICVMGPGDFTSTGHFIVLTGITDGMIRVNDPNSIANSNTLWRYEDIESQIRNIWVISNQ